ncbi:hypothetical protein LCGC14_1792650, partial [marine sediment metagenome]
GHYDPHGVFRAESDHPTKEAARVRVHFLNGGSTHHRHVPVRVTLDAPIWIHLTRQRRSEPGPVIEETDFWMNAAHIVTMAPHSEGGSMVTTEQRRRRVQETPEEIVAMIRRVVRADEEGGA